MAISRLISWFPHVKAPVIINAPMLGSAGAAMATEVYKAGGFGKGELTLPYSSQQKSVSLGFLLKNVRLTNLPLFRFHRRGL